MCYRQQLGLCLKPRAVRPFVWGSVSSPPSTLSAIHQHADKSFSKPLCLTWFSVDPRGWDHVRYLSILHCLFCHPHIRERRIRRSSFVILGLVSAGVPPLFRSRNPFCVCYIVFLLTASGDEARTSAGTQNDVIYHISSSRIGSGLLSICNTHIYPPLYACL